MSYLTVDQREAEDLAISSIELARPPNRVQTKVLAAGGNFVVHIPIASGILETAASKEGDEFNHVTYTAVTKSISTLGEIEGFPGKYDLRQRLFRRQTKVALVITMYNEDSDLFIKSMTAVQRNIAYLCSSRCPFSWGKEGWKNFVVVIVSDGRSKINPRVLTVLELMGIYVPALPRSSIDGVAVSAHIFESTTQIAIGRGGQILSAKDGIVPTQVIFLLKEQNAKKINSHKWFFSAICETIKPDVCMLLDVGTKPSNDSLMHLWRAFDRDPMVGGACGEIVAELGTCWKNLLNPLVAAQNFEYKMSNILDKPLESVFGYISVLPGAFSAYRYSALAGRPLEQYFKGEQPGADIFTSNLYLAEDRILCFELVVKRREPWTLKYVKSAYAETDVPNSLDELTSQRRRWLNGSFFASVHSLLHWRMIYSSSHSMYQKTLFTIEFLYNAVNLWFTWFGIANFYLTFFFLFNVRKSGAAGIVASLDQSQTDPFFPYGDMVFQTLQGLYLFGLFSMIVTALGNRPRGTRWLYMTLCIFFSCVMCLMIFMSVWAIKLQVTLFTTRQAGSSYSAVWDYLITTPEFREMVIAVASTYFLYLISSFIALDFAHCVTSMTQYLVLLPTYIMIFNVYSFCNLHDVSWGTKGASKDDMNEAPAFKKTLSDGAAEYEYVSTQSSDLDAQWNQCLARFKSEIKSKNEGGEKREEKVKKEDSARSFRTKMVLSWFSTNAFLIVLFTNEGSLKAFFPRKNTTINPYLTFLFWSFAGLAFVRFIGAVLFTIQSFKERLRDVNDSLMNGGRARQPLKSIV